MILDWLEVAVQATAAAGLIFTVTVCGLVIRMPFQPTLRPLEFTESADVWPLALAVKFIEKRLAPLRVIGALVGLNVTPLLLAVTM